MEKSSRLVATGVGLAVLVGLGAGAWALRGTDVPTSAPYTDERSAGRLTLCDADGNQVTQGSTEATPFVTAVVGTTGLPAETSPEGAVGTVFVHQPRAGVGSEEFSGTPLSSTATLEDSSTPAVRINEETWSVADFTTAFPAELDGFVQVRLVLGTPQQGTLTEADYDSLDLWVDEGTWHAVDPGDADCAAALH